MTEIIQFPGNATPLTEHDIWARGWTARDIAAHLPAPQHYETSPHQLFEFPVWRRDLVMRIEQERGLPRPGVLERRNRGRTALTKHAAKKAKEAKKEAKATKEPKAAKVATKKAAPAKTAAKAAPKKTAVADSRAKMMIRRDGALARHRAYQRAKMVRQAAELKLPFPSETEVEHAWWAHFDATLSDDGLPRVRRESWTVDHLLRTVYGLKHEVVVPGSRPHDRAVAYWVLRTRAALAIAIQYPELAEEVRRRMEPASRAGKTGGAKRPRDLGLRAPAR